MNAPIETTTNGRSYFHGNIKTERPKYGDGLEREVTVDLDFSLLTERQEDFKNELTALVQKYAI